MAYSKTIVFGIATQLLLGGSCAAKSRTEDVLTKLNGGHPTDPHIFRLSPGTDAFDRELAIKSSEYWKTVFEIGVGTLSQAGDNSDTSSTRDATTPESDYMIATTQGGEHFFYGGYASNTISCNTMSDIMAIDCLMGSQQNLNDDYGCSVELHHLWLFDDCGSFFGVFICDFYTQGSCASICVGVGFSGASETPSECAVIFPDMAEVDCFGCSLCFSSSTGTMGANFNCNNLTPVDGCLSDPVFDKNPFYSYRQQSEASASTGSSTNAIIWPIVCVAFVILLYFILKKYGCIVDQKEEKNEVEQSKSAETGRSMDESQTVASPENSTDSSQAVQESEKST